MKVNKHNLKMDGLKKASGMTCRWCGYTQISYDMETGDVLAVDHIRGEWSQYHDPAVVHVFDAYDHFTMQQIADRIALVIADRNMWAAYYDGGANND